MTTGLGSIELSDDQRKALHLQLTGRPGMATREMVKKWALKLIGDTIDGQVQPTGKTRLMNTVCPKCSRPISVKVPVQDDPAPAAATPAPGRGGWSLDPSIAKDMKAAADALTKMAAKIEGGA